MTMAVAFDTESQPIHLMGCYSGSKARLFLFSGSRERRPYFFENQNKNKSDFNLFYFYFFRPSQFSTAKRNKS